MRLKHLSSDCTGTLYAVAGNGDLLWYADTARDGTNGADGRSGWHENSGNTIGSGWDRFVHVCAGGQGILYAVTPAGELLWFQYLLCDGTNGPDGKTGWHANSGNVVGSGWDCFVHVCAGGQGILYGVTPAGELFWFQDICRDGTNGADGGSGWHPSSGKLIGAGWDRFVHVFADLEGQLYGIDPAGDLLWFRDMARDGTNDAGGQQGWHPNSGRVIDRGWVRCLHAMSGGAGIIYMSREEQIHPRLVWYRDCRQDGTNNPDAPRPQEANYLHPSRSSDPGVPDATSGWDTNSGSFIEPPWQTVLRELPPEVERGNVWSVGWEIIPIEGYCWPMSASPGETIEFFLSARIPAECPVQYVRLCEQGGALGVPKGDPFTVRADWQASPATAWRDGCGWRTNFQLQIPPDWVSGYYAARCKAAGGYSFDIPFIVKPALGHHSDILFLSNVNTWNSYNTWGDFSNYTLRQTKPLSFLRPNYHLLTGPSDAWNACHLIRGEMWIHDWLASEGRAADVYTDIDLHEGIESLSSYRVMMVHTHPEYWSGPMRDALGSYVDQGGNLLYLGGNGIFRWIEYDTGIAGQKGSVARFVTTEALDWAFTKKYPEKPERSVLGVSNHSLAQPATSAGFRVDAVPEELFRGTQVAVGDLIGASGRIGGGSGCEADRVDDIDAAGPAPEGVVRIAHGDHENGGDIAYYKTPAGGFVLSAGSITFGGSLVVDSILQRMVLNALENAGA